LEARGIRCGDAEADVGAQSTDIRDVTNEPLELEPNQANGRGSRRNLDPAGILHRLAVAHCMREAVVTGDGFREHGSVNRRLSLEESLRAFVSVGMSQLEMQNRVADNAETEMSRFDDAGVNRADC